MARQLLDKARLARWSGRSVASYVDFVHRTSKIIVEPADLDAVLALHRPAIIAVWHGQFLLAPRIKPLQLPLAVMLARHGDAEHFAHALERFNTTLIRGAGAGARKKDRGGAHALRAALRALEQDVFVGMTADVPPGPARRAGEGIVTLARLSGRPIIPLAVASSRYRALPTWSRMTINMPFGTLAAVFGEPIVVRRDAGENELEALRLAVQQGLDAATARAYLLAGSDPARATPREGARRRSGAGTAAIGKAQAHDVGEEAGATEIRGKRGRAGGSAGGSAALACYKVATRMLQPAVPLVLGARARRGKEDDVRRPERLGFASRPRPPGRLVWIHAASVGELQAILPLSAELRQARADLTFLFTTGTVTSAGLAAARIGAGDIHQYLPLDAPAFVARFLDHWRPDLAVLTESDIWPNLVLQTAARDIPLALVNARMSKRSHERWRKLKTVAAPLFGCFDVVLAQNEEMAACFAEIGARRALAVGNLKIDAPPPPVDQQSLAALREALAGRPLFVGASTHEGEEQAVLQAHRQLVRGMPGLCTLLAPRHPERGTVVAELAKSMGLTVAQRSTGRLPAPTTDIYVADTIGELGTFYAAAPVAFIGGSLVRRGGQNPIEAIRHGAVVLSGPNWQNFRDAYETLLQHHGALVVHGAEEMAAAVSRLSGDSVEIQRVRSGAQTALGLLAGALPRTVRELLRFIPDDEEMRRAG